MKNTRLLIVIALGVVCLAVVLFYFISQQNRIEVKNQSMFYHVGYNSGKEFNEYLNNLGIWKEKNIKIDDNPTLYTIKKIQIIVTDEKQDRYKFNEFDTNSIATTADASITNNGVLQIKISINPLYTAKSQPNLENANQFFLGAVLYILNSSTRKTSDPTENFKEIGKVWKKFNLDTNPRPFSVTLKNAK